MKQLQRRSRVRRPSDIDRLIAQVAASQLGVVCARSAGAVGVPPESLACRAQRGTLHRLYRGIYSVVPHPALSWEGRCLAALLAVGDGAALGRRSALELLKVSRWPGGAIEVASPRRHGGLHDAHVYRAVSLAPCDVATRGRLTYTRVPRLLSDLARDHTAWQLAYVMDRCAYRRLLDVHEAAAFAACNERRAGHARLTKALALHVSGSRGTTSGLEDEFIEWSEPHWPVEPCVNEPLQGMGQLIVPDFRWGRVCVEVDGPHHEYLPSSMLIDPIRQQTLEAHGFIVLRIRDDQVYARDTRFLGDLLHHIAAQ